MKHLKYIFTTAILCCSLLVGAQDAAALYESGKAHLMKGDYDNAVLVLKKATTAAPGNFTYAKDLTTAYFLRGEVDNAKTNVEKLLESSDADEELFLLAGNIYKSKQEAKLAEKTYKKGLKKFDKSGGLYNAYGELLWMLQDYSAIKQWEKGISVAPNVASNYYNAAIHYYLTKDANDKVWSAYYGEIFVNLESFTTRTIEVKGIVLDSYKRLFADDNFLKSKSSNKFETSFKDYFKKHGEVINNGVTTGSLTMFRTRLILDWYNASVNQENALYEKHQQLLKEGLFEAYNYWLFESVINLSSFENWVNTHKNSYDMFSAYSKNRIFRLKGDEYYK
jgi:tetratricopeptide (TPR) repeat protein